MNNSWMKLAAAAVLAAGLAAAQTPAPQPPPGPGRLAPRAGIARRILANLGLTPAQRQQARDILQKARAQAQPLRRQMRQDRQAMAEAVKSNDTVKIQQLATVTGTLAGQLTGLRAAAEAQVYALLTPDQKARADQMRQKVRQRIQQRRGAANG